MIVLVDTGVLVALIDPDTREHQWAQEWARRLPQPFQTSEPVLTEAAFLLARDGFDADELFALAEAGVTRSASALKTSGRLYANSWRVTAMCRCPWPTRRWSAWRN
jgi:predicted nucleic acid-binding protein